MAYLQTEINQLVEEVKQKMELEKVDVIVSCKCGYKFESTWIVGSMTDWRCPECGRMLGMDRVKRKGD